MSSLVSNRVLAWVAVLGALATGLLLVRMSRGS